MAALYHAGGAGRDRIARDRLLMECRPAAVAGTFYPGTRAALERAVDALMSDARARSAAHQTAPKALIVPHAGYVYSGPIAATAFATVEPVAARIRRVVLVGPAHRAYVSGLASAGVDAFETPLGRVDIDTAALGSLSFVQRQPAAHAREHSLEVELPFVQKVLPDARIVPLLVSDAAPRVVGETLEALWGGPETLVLISSDLSHYLPYATARALDESTADRIARRDDAIEPDLACGSAAVNGLAWVARRRPLSVRILDLRSSGDTAGQKDQVVGYGAFAFDEPAAEAP